MKWFVPFFLFLLLFVTACKEKNEIDKLTASQLSAFNYLPAETEFLTFMNINELKKTEFWNNYFLTSLKNDNTLNLLFNFEKSKNENKIKQIFTASGENGNNITVILFNKVNLSLKYYIQNSSDFRTNNIKDKNIYLSKYDKKSNLFFPNDSILIVFNDQNYINDLLLSSNKSLKNNKKLLSVIDNIKNKNHFWIVADDQISTALLIKKMVGNHYDFSAQKLLKSVGSISLSAEFSDKIEIESNLKCSNSKNAFLISTAIKGALAMDLLSKGNPSLSKTFENIEVERSEADINLSIYLDKKDIKELTNLVKNKHLDLKL